VPVQQPPGPRPAPPARPDLAGGALPLAVPTVGEPAGFTLARTAVLAGLAIGVARLVTAPQDDAWAVLCVIVVGTLCRCGNPATAIAGAATAWLLGDGFLTHRLGDLGFGAADRGTAAAALVAALVALAVGRRATVAVRRDTAVARLPRQAPRDGDPTG